ncbi:MAG: hypothetical protein OEZ02_06480 [Anaerolineae bacterium]|nr:hypothetical protein [Anaerolineae bacterium]
MYKIQVKLVLVAALLLVSCGKTIPNAVKLTPTRGITPSAVARPVQTISPTPYNPPTPTEVLPYSLQLTPLPQPQLVETVVNLFETNGGCRLPCWWGITPGQTTWEQAFQILEPITDRISFSFHRIRVNVPAGDAFSRPYLYQIHSVDDNQVITMITASLADPYPFWLTDMVAQYGLPDEIVLGGWYPLADGVTAYFALYEEQGFLIYYSAKINVRDEILEVCPYKDHGIEITSWDIGYHSYLDLFMDIARASQDPDLILNSNVFLSSVTFLSVSDFIDLYQQPYGCFDTPGSMWLEFDYVSR